MPPIPTYSASGRLRGAPAVDAPSLGAAIAPGAAIARVGDTLSDAGGVLGARARRDQVEQEQRDREADRILEQRDREDELRWATDAAGRFDRSLTEFRMQYRDKPSEVEGVEFREFADKLYGEYVAAAPSQRAADTFSRHGVPAVNNGYESSLLSGEKTRLTNSLKSNRDSAADLIQSFRYQVDLDGAPAALADLKPYVDFQLATIQARYGETAPATAAAMSEYLVTEVVLATAPHDAAFARSMVAKAPISEQERVQLGAKIDTIEGSLRQVDRFQFLSALDTGLKASLQTGNAPPAFSVDDFALFGADAAIQHAHYTQRRDIIVASQTAAKSLANVNPATQAKRLSELRKTGDPAQQQHLDVLERMVAQSKKLATKDPMQWQLANDPIVQSAMESARAMGNDPAFVAAATYIALERQGMPMPGDTGAELYLGAPKPRVLTEAEADQRKRILNAASPDDKLKFLDNLTAEFNGDATLAHYAYRDMLELGNEKIPVTYRFSSIITALQTRKEFIDAQSNAKAIAAISDESRKTYTDVLNASGEWQKFSAGWMGESGEGSTDMTDAKAALIAYAEHLYTAPGAAGVSSANAMKQAIQLVIAGNYGFASVNGRYVPIARDRLSGGPPRSDLEIGDIGRRLGVALRDVPIQELATHDPYNGEAYYTLPPTFDAKKPEDAQILRDIITSRGFWQTDATGEMVTLMVAEARRAGFAVLDRNHQKLTVKLDDLPSFVRTRPGALGAGVVQADQPKGSWPIIEWDVSPASSVWPWSPTRTNWPRRQPWMTAPPLSPNLP